MAAEGHGGGGGGAVRAAKAFVEIYAESAPFMQGLAGIKSKFLGWGKSLGVVGAAVGAAGAAITVPMEELFRHAVEKGTAFAEMSERLGASTEEISLLGFAAEQSGASLEEMEKGLSKMRQNIGAGKVVGSLDLGTLKGKGLVEQSEIISDYIEKLGTADEKIAAIREIAGKSGTELAGFFKELKESVELGKDLGVGYKQEDAENAKKIDQAFKIIWRTISAIKGAVGKAILPLADEIKEFAIVLAKLAQPIGKFLKDNSKIIMTVFAVGAALVAVGAIIGTFAAGLALVGVAISAVAAIWGVIVAVFWAAVSPIGLIIGGLTLIVASVGVLLYNFTSLGEIFETTWGGIAAAISKGDLELAMEIAWLGMKLVWHTGVAWLKEIWVDFMSWFARLTNNMSTNLAKAMVQGLSLLPNTLLSALGLGNLKKNYAEIMRGLELDRRATEANIRGQQTADKAAANADAERTRAELEEAIARAKAVQEKAEKKADAIVAASDNMMKFGEIKGAFGANLNSGALGFGNGKSIAENTSATAKNTAKTNELLKNKQEAVFDD